MIWAQHQRSQELRLVSTREGNWQWLTGATWLDESPQLNVGLVRHPLNNSTLIYAQATTEAWGMYGELGWDFQPDWNLKLGLRDTRETRVDGNRLFTTGDLKGLDSPNPTPQPIGSSAHDARFSKLSPQLVLSVSPSATAAQDMWYLSATEGFKSGGANSLSTLPGFKPEEITSLETGYKYSHESLALQVAAFHYDYRDLQVITYEAGATIITYEAGATIITNAASASLQGLDLNLRWSLAQQWQYQLGATWLDSHYQRFITSLAGQPEDVSGNPMPFAPKLDLNQSVSYQLAQHWQISLQHHYQSRTYYNQFGDTTISSPARHLFNLHLQWMLDSHWELAAGIYNLTDKNYYQNLTRFSSTASVPTGNALGVTAPGRQWLVEANYRY